MVSPGASHCKKRALARFVFHFAGTFVKFLFKLCTSVYNGTNVVDFFAAFAVALLAEGVD